VVLVAKRPDRRVDAEFPSSQVTMSIRVMAHRYFFPVIAKKQTFGCASVTMEPSARNRAASRVSKAAPFTAMEP
jgi:hypothetical protein